jgi:hypothetical protein
VVKDQTNALENGPYLYGAPSGGFAALTRLSDFDSHIAAGAGLSVTVREGTANGSTTWKATGGSPIVTTAATALDQSPIDLDIEDFWLAADGDDYSPSFHRAMRAVQLSVAFGRINFRRVGSYRMRKPCWVTNGCEIAGKASGYKGTGTFLNFDGAGFLVASTPVGVSAAGTIFRDIYLQGPSSTAGGDQHGIESSRVRSCVSKTSVFKISPAAAWF